MSKAPSFTLRTSFSSKMARRPSRSSVSERCMVTSVAPAGWAGQPSLVSEHKGERERGAIRKATCGECSSSRQALPTRL